MRTVPHLQTNKLVIGYSLGALEYAKASGALLLLNGEVKPHEYEASEDYKRWNSLVFQLGMAGQQPLPSKIETIRIEENTVNISTEFYRSIKISFNDLHIFDLNRVEGINAAEDVSEYLVYDWFDIKRGARHNKLHLYGATDFVRELIFYPSTRRDGNSGDIKDCYTKSFIGGGELAEFETSPTSARLAALSLMNQEHLRGSPSIIQEKNYYSSVVLEHRRRDVYKKKKKYIINEDLPNNVHWHIIELW
tara:strand:+ start:254 stop:1000 length:747 start_codon:yes stop_codon:yes gene_type:complete